MVKTSDRLTPAEIAARCGFHRATVARWCRLGLLPTQVLPSGRRRVPVEAVERFLRVRGGGHDAEQSTAVAPPNNSGGE